MLNRNSDIAEAAKKWEARISKRLTGPGVFLLKDRDTGEYRDVSRSTWLAAQVEAFREFENARREWLKDVATGSGG